MSTSNHPVGRVSAMAAPLGARVEVFGFDSDDPWNAEGKMHRGVVMSVVDTGSPYLGTRITFEDGHVVYARQYAVCWVLERQP